MGLDGKVVAVTGGGRGIGKSIALAHGRSGAKVAVLSRTVRQVEETASEINMSDGVAIGLPLDATDRGAVESVFAEINSKLGPVDVLINNAGAFAAIGPIWEVDPDLWWDDVQGNILPTFNCTRSVIPGMLERGNGRIINLIGAGTAGPLPYGTSYAIGKSGIMRFTESLAESVRAQGIFVFAMAPGLVKTAMTDYQLTTEAGQKYMAGISKRFEEGDFLPAEKAAALSVEIAGGRFDKLSGRGLSAWDDLEKLEAQVDDILENDQRVLRVPGLGPSMKPTD